MAAPLEYVFEAGEQNSPDAVTKVKAAEIAADFMTTFITYRSEHWKRRNFGQCPFRFGLFASPTRSRVHSGNFYFAVLLPDGTVVEPTVAKRL